jgi:Peptidase family M1 domain
MRIRLLRIFLFTTVFLFLSGPAFLSSQPLSRRVVSYELDVRLDAAKKTITGNELLNWKNTSRAPVKELQLHLYLNAFKNTCSTFMKESRRSKSDLSKEENCGYIDILSIKRAGFEDLTDKIKFIAPDDGNPEDQTVVSLSLNKPVRPGEEIQLEIGFISKLPLIIARTGYAGDYFLVGQWFPKIGVYEYPGIRYAEKGGWNCHQFHANSEFYADFALYNVKITLPGNYIVGSTGVERSGTVNKDGTATYFFTAEDVIDFAWTASPYFKTVVGNWKNVKIKLLLQPEHFSQADRYMSSLKSAFDYFDRNLGSYPYPTLTLVDPPFIGMNSGGMEYPTFITTGTLWNLPEGIRYPEIATVHEFGHNYFMAILATNEFEEAFLDEGFNQYYETRIMDYIYGTKSSAFNIAGFRAGDFEFSRSGYTNLKNPKIAEIFRKSWEYPLGGYGAYTYSKTAVMLKTLEGLVGLPAMDEIMKTYFRRWKFRHPCVKDFIEIVNETVLKKNDRNLGENMNWFFDEVLYGSDICDYQLASITNLKKEKPQGLFDSSGVKKESGWRRNEDATYNSSVVVFRNGGVILPVEVLVHFDNGKEILEIWDGKARTVEFKYNGESKILWAKTDPNYKIPLDINIVNNSLSSEPETGFIDKYSAKILFWMENILIGFSTLF